MKHTAKVASSVVFVSVLDRSQAFYCDVFGCEVAIRDEEAALLLTPGGFQMYLIAKGSRAQHPSGGIGHEFLMWSTDSVEGLEHFERVLRDCGSYKSTHTTGGVRFVEGHDPDGIRVVIAHPSPEQLPRSVLSPRLYS